MGANQTSCVILRHSSTPLLLVSKLFLLPDLPSSRSPPSCPDLPLHLQQRVSLLWTILARVTLLLDDIIKVRSMGAILPYLFLHCLSSKQADENHTSRTADLQVRQAQRSHLRTWLLRHLKYVPPCRPPQYKQEDCLDNDRRITVTTYYPCWAPHT